MLFNFTKFHSNFNGYPKYSLIIIIQFLISSYTYGQWVKQSPVPTFLEVHGIGAPLPEKLFVGTADNSFDNGGALFQSDDGGSSWQQLNIPISLNDGFNGLFFLDSLNGWAYGNDNYGTTDGGTTWNQLPFLGSTYFMKFYTPLFGNANGNFGNMISRDGGLSWIESPNGMSAFSFSGNLVGLGVSENGIFRTTDGGNIFSQVLSGNSKSTAFLSPDIAVGIADSTFIRSTDGGITWTPIGPAGNLDQLFAVSSEIVIAWNQSFYFQPDSSISRSSDGGQTWNNISTSIVNGFHSLVSSTSLSISASDSKGNMFISTDGGLTWMQTFNSPGPMPGVFGSSEPVFADAQTGYFGYGSGFIIKTTNGGNSWFQISGGTGQNINDIDRFPGGRLIAGGDNGAILIKDAAANWILKQSQLSENITAVQVLNNNQAFALSAGGQVYATSDSGESWNVFGIPVPISSAKDLHFTSLNEGWITGSAFLNSALFHTTNGGITWIPNDSIIGTYIGIDFEGSNGWLFTPGEAFYRTTDNGTTWIPGVLPGFPFTISDFEFFDSNFGYAVGYGGYAVRSSDGGLSWEELPVPETADGFTDVYLTEINELWVTTKDDEVYYSATGGQNWSFLEINSSGFGYFNSIVANPEGNAWTTGYQGYIMYFEGPPPPPLNRLPEASFDYTASGLTLFFTDTSFDPDGTIINWQWDFGDTNFSSEQNPVHLFPRADTYIIKLTVTDDDSASDSFIRIIAVQPGPGGVFGNLTEVTPLDSIFVTPEDEDFWIITTAPADFDIDGDLDIAVLGYYVVYNQSVEEKLLLLRNDGPDSLTHWNFEYINIPLEGLTTGASDLAWGDVDRDGDPDLAVGTDMNSVIYRNDNGSLVMSDTELPGYLEDNDQAEFDLRSITWADYDNDGDPDLLLPSVFDDTSFSYRTSLMRNDGINGTGGWIFTEIDSVFAPTSHAQSAWADYDGDQDLDLFLINLSPLNEEGFIRLYRNDGNGIFTGEEILDSIIVEHGEAQWGDYDGDGDLDILIAGNIRELSGGYTEVLRIYRNEQNSFVPVEVVDCIPCVGWIDLTAATWADYDSDGDMDILAAGNYNSGSQIEGRAKIYINNNGTFTDSGSDLPAPHAAGDRGGTFSWLDIDGDGDLDYFIAGQYFVPGGNGLVEAQMHVYRNDIPLQNSAPTGTSNLNAVMQSDSTVLLTWTPASDDHTPAAALTYDLEVYHNNLPVGFPSRVPEPGSISSTDEWLLGSLEEGNYKWVIRAVDAAYIGGPIAAGEFTIGITGLKDNNTPAVYSLANNYPNPFNPSTIIRYSIPEISRVSLKIYNSLGEELITLINETASAAGNYEILWDAGNLPSGVYFYQLKAGEFIETKKMILMK